MIYQTENWKVSPWNDYTAVKRTLNCPEKVLLHDTTLRDGEQAAGVQFSYENKVAIGRSLIEAGVDRIEVCMPAVSEDDRRALTELAKHKTDVSKIYAFSRANPKDVQMAVDCGADGVCIEIPASNAVYPSYGWTEDEAALRAAQALTYAKEHGLETTLFLMDGTRGELHELTRLIAKVAAQADFDSVALVDTLGVLTPEAVRHGVAAVRDAAGGRSVEIHCHNDFGLAVANTMAAITCGAQVAHTTVLGMGDRAGGAPLEEIAIALPALYGIQTNLDTTKLKNLAAQVARASGVVLPNNKAVVGPNLFTTESGIPVMIQRRNKMMGNSEVEVWPFIPQYVGFKNSKIALGKFSGAYSVRAYLEDMGIPMEDDKVKILTQNVKDLSIEKGALLTLDDFKDLIAAVR